MRRAWLCGQDPLTGVNFNHRRGWIEAKALELADIFSVSVYAYAVMSNHMHLVVFVDPDRVTTWTDEEVADRWSRLGTRLVNTDGTGADQAHELKRDAILDNPRRLHELRYRLGNLSWFMRFLNETIARAANQEDGCTGRFWEGRFGCKALRDETAVLGCMSYVDLNPIRGGLATSLETSEYTSVKRRCHAAKQAPASLEHSLLPMAGPPVKEFPPIRICDYLDLVEGTARLTRTEDASASRRLSRRVAKVVACDFEHWKRLALGLEAWFGSAVGAREALRTFAKLTQRRWIKGMATTW